ncbi:inosine/xanthosine triphosphatase [Photobacterium aquimaris]|uniref:Inosine/xanthosine triphosphatase n=1 Tax=Photobacterium aquimaris TaxID=512643 RepID=A0A2T3HYU8_9GAMM|nr:inosine/xanthosine triphosphatase [Photobacterium aquimaris]OBU18269.1 inosine/xanthosine triphosphatase [Photobacterium aquimaris]PQJ40312.1 inosine/xanthosine triphosphatase [Photobacterium aquimaris]PSU05617.1 non-canonical purine NTP phosphatase [Photobacterium aquimaris]
MPTIIVASANPAKITAVSNAFKDAFPQQQFTITGVSTVSGVRDQPLTSEETLLGANNRVAYCRERYPSADYIVGLEAGLDCNFTFAWMVIEHQGKKSTARSASLPLPPLALAKIAQGIELGDVMDEMFAQQNIKQKGGAIAMLTQHLLTRSSVYQQALILALIPFLNPELY